jgi:DNA polymerase-4
MQERSVIHFNVADFAVSVERVVDSGLKQRPLIIASLQAARAEVYDMSEEAFKEGVRKGMALRRATKMCRGAALLSPRPALYQKAMAAFLKVVRNYSPRIECGSVDGHFFVDVTGTHRLYGPPPDIGLRVRRYVRTHLGINPIWTLGTSKLVAKVASRLVKPVGEYIVSPGEEALFLAPLPVSLLPGLTRRELQKLERFDLKTIGALAGLSRQQLMVPFGSRSDYLHEISQGIDESMVSVPSSTMQSVDCEYSFADDSNNRQKVEAAVTDLVGRTGLQLRASRQVARRVGVWLRYSDGTHVVRQASCRRGSNNDFVLCRLALTALQRAWIRRTRIRSCRLVCDRLQNQSPQLLLFPDKRDKEQRQEKVLGAMDTIRSRFGHRSIHMGNQCRIGDPVG